VRAAGLIVPILTWLNPSGVDAEAAATGRIDIAVGSVDELEALLKQTSSACPTGPLTPGHRHGPRRQPGT
jgi:hypothetical protein